MHTVNFAEILSLLPRTENPKESSVGGVPYVLHEDHRWLLPIVNFAQQNGFLPRPCTVVMFDQHHDALDPSDTAVDVLRQLSAQPTSQGIISLCAEHLKKVDDDWLKAGMELGFFGDAVIFGVHDRFDARNFRDYTDHSGGRHRIEMSSRPRSGLAYQGHLSDLARRSEFEPLWKILGWEIRGGTRFHFLPGLPKVLLTIDLDCFAVPWSDYTFAWPVKIWESEFLQPSDYNSTFGWTGQSFMQEIASKAGLVAITRESQCCGGTEDAQGILEDLIHYGFADRLSF